jgi:hypothetical protein
METTTTQRRHGMTFFNRTLAIATVAIALIVPFKVATAGATSTHLIPCGTGTYGLAGDWGPGSLLAHTPHNVRLIHHRYGYGTFAHRVIHNITPPRCR